MNSNQEINAMKTLIYSILTVVAIIILFAGCENEKENAEQLVLSGKIVSHSDCKNDKSDSVLLISDSSSCADFSFDATTNRLYIKHINAGFNCCPDSLYCTVKVSNDTIIIQEFENEQLCNCSCLYDLDIEIEGVGSQKYQIKFIEPYCGNQEQIIFGVDFSVQKQGLYCVTRNQYPWGI